MTRTEGYGQKGGKSDSDSIRGDESSSEVKRIDDTIVAPEASTSTVGAKEDFTVCAKEDITVDQLDRALGRCRALVGDDYPLVQRALAVRGFKMRLATLAGSLEAGAEVRTRC